jgi:hypothetical protein
VFVTTFAALSAAAVGLLAAAHLYLGQRGILPPPPLVATSCIDSKIDFLANAPLGDTQLLAVGSSATWRNLDLRIIERRFGWQALNGAPCYLFADQTARWASFLTQYTPNLKRLLVVFHPRDFAQCRPQDQEFLPQRMAHAVFSHLLPIQVAYLTGFKPAYLVREAAGMAQRPRPAGQAYIDGRGSEPLNEPEDWSPELVIDERCFDGVRQLGKLARSNPFDLSIVLMPIESRWKADADPSGEILATWASRVVSEAGPQVSVIDLRELDWSSDRFADPVHLLAPFVAPFTERIADEMAAGLD